MKQSLHIGLNYRNSPYELGGCENDAIEMAGRAANCGFGLTEIVSSDISVEAFAEKMRWLQHHARKSTTTLITFSGHGTQYPDPLPDIEDDRMGEGLCFWNGEEIEVLPDNDFRALVRQIPGIVFVVLDSCFSGGMERNAPKPPPHIKLKKRFIPFDPETMQINWRYSQSRATLQVPNKTYWLFASQENEVSWDTGKAGWFTENFCRAFDQHPIQRRTVKNVMQETLFLCKPDQHPLYICEGGNGQKRLF